MNDTNPIVHIVKPGDTLYSIAAMHGVSVNDIMESNFGLDPYFLRIGQQIYIYPKTGSMDNYLVSMAQVRLLEKMNLAWEQHIMWTRMLLISIAADLNDLEYTERRLMRNPRDIADIFRTYYGDRVANEIERLLTEHLKIGKEIIVALKNKDNELATSLSKSWYENADQMAEAFSSINPFYDKEAVRKMLYEHLELTTKEVTSRLSGNYEEDIKAYDMVQREALDMSQYFVSGIIKQFPNRF